MNADNQIPDLKSYEEIAEFWGTHSLADYWDQTEPAGFKISPQARRSYLVAIDPSLLRRAQQICDIFTSISRDDRLTSCNTGN